MVVEMRMPSPGESITEVEIAQWLVANGDYVERDQFICEIDSDKATLELNAEESGVIKIIAKEGETIAIGDMVCTIDTGAPPRPSPKGRESQRSKSTPDTKEKKERKTTEIEPAVQKLETQNLPTGQAGSKLEALGYAAGHPSPAAKKIMNENNISQADINGTGKGGRITKADALKAVPLGFKAEALPPLWGGSGRGVERKKMSSLRKKLSQRLVAVKNQTAMLTTFNEVNMSAIMTIRKKYKEQFEKKHGVKLGFMSFFTKAITEALGNFPAVNAMIDGDEIVYYKFADIGIAVSSPKGLVVPVLRNAESMTFAQVESVIKRLAVKAREGKITLEEMTGGTFTITNGGVFGSMMSTPILNPPQSAILGMHNIVERPIAVNGKVEIHPMMYVALSYDHRIIDGKESVGFLVEVKEMLEDPVKLHLGDKNPVKKLLGL